MERLTQRIQERLQKQTFCRVFPNELNVAWPPSRKEQSERYERIRQIRDYAAAHGWSVIVRDAGLQATFRWAARP
jgi:hypothetical protein